MNRLLLILSLIYLFSGSIPGFAQSFDQLSSRIRSIEEENEQAKNDWANKNDHPLILHLADESIIGLAGIQKGQPVYFTTHNQHAGLLTRTVYLHPSGTGEFQLSGHNLVVGLWDGSPAYDNHQEHRTRVIPKETGGPTNHATHVAGTLIASGVLQEALGMAPGARVHSYNWNFHTSEMMVEAREGLLISNHSYGRIAGWHKFQFSADSTRWQWFGNPAVNTREDYLFGFYDRDASLFDDVTYTHPYYLPVVSAGNERDDAGPESGTYLALDSESRWREYDASVRPIPPDGSPDGYDTVTSFATAKNVLTVGSVVQYSLSDQPSVSIFSSAGPTDDGRIKPDLVGMGENLFSTVATGTSDYAVFSGTSMSTPNVAGSLILLQQLSKQLLGNPLRASTIKGLAIHTATDIGQPGPDYLTGWGLLNTEKAARHIQAMFRNPILIHEEQISNADVFELELLALSEGEIRITLCWTDPPFEPLVGTGQDLLDNRTPVLVNDLNVRLIRNEDNEAYFPFVLTPGSPEKTATTGINNVDPVEQIYIPSARPGLYTLYVDQAGNNLVSGNQNFSLLISGFVEPLAPVVLDTAQINVSIGNVVLDWETQAENLPGEFIIERADLSITHQDGTFSKNFKRVAVLPSEGPTSNSHAYQFKDELFLEGEYLYRVLFLPAETGERMLLAEFQIDMPAPSSFDMASIYPNPVSRQGTIILDVPEDRDIEIAIYNILGQRLSYVPLVNYPAGRHFVEFDTSTWSEGIYFAYIRSKEFHVSRSFVVLN